MLPESELGPVPELLLEPLFSVQLLQPVPEQLSEPLSLARLWLLERLSELQLPVLWPEQLFLLEPQLLELLEPSVLRFLELELLPELLAYFFFHRSDR